MPLSDYERQRIVAIHLTDITRKTPAEIQRIMQLEGTQTSYQAVQATIKRWKETGGYKLIPNEHYGFIDEAMEKNDELTVSNLMEALQEVRAQSNEVF